jgi:hypothetical protein
MHPKVEEGLLRRANDAGAMSRVQFQTMCGSGFDSSVGIPQAGALNDSGNVISGKSVGQYTMRTKYDCKFVCKTMAF